MYWAATRDAATVQTQFNAAQSAYQTNLSGIDGQLNAHQQQAQQAVATDTSTYQSDQTVKLDPVAITHYG